MTKDCSLNSPKNKSIGSFSCQDKRYIRCLYSVQWSCFKIFIKMLESSFSLIDFFCIIQVPYSEALILASVNPQHDKRLFIEIPKKYKYRTCSVQILFWISKQKQTDFKMISKWEMENWRIWKNYIFWIHEFSFFILFFFICLCVQCCAVYQWFYKLCKWNISTSLMSIFLTFWGSPLSEILKSLNIFKIFRDGFHWFGGQIRMG